MATGKRTNNGWVAQDPLTSEKLETIVDIASRLGKRTGVITTDELTGATPMGFAGHSASRSSANELIKSAVDSNVNLFISNKYAGEVNLINGGYKKINDPTKISESKEEKLCGTYTILSAAPSMHVGEDFCALDGIVTEALDYLAQDEDGFFLMAEGALIDKRSHDNNFESMIWELMAFDDAVQAVLNWAKDRDDTVVIVTADHETGGLELSDKITKENMFTQTSFAKGGHYQWSSKDHTSEDVYCFINGANIDFSQYSFNSASRIKNTDIFYIMKALLGV
jgi:alkaline phosphatase